MRILYLTNGFPFPLTSGYLRHYFLIRELSRRHEISLLSIVRSNFEAEHVEPLRPLTRRVLTFPLAARSGLPVRKALSRARTAAGHDPAIRAMCTAVRRLRSEEPFDLVLFSGRQTFPAMRHLGRLPVVVDLCDAASARILGAARYGGMSRMPLMLVNYLQMRRVERRLMRGAAHLLFISCRDRDALLGGNGRRATIVPNGVDCDFWSRCEPPRGGKTIVFTGGMNYPPNIDAACHLIEDIFPLVQRSVPDAEVMIVGRDPTPRLIRAGRRRGVTVTGFVDDVRPYLQRADVFAAPLRFGAGVQNKLLEAMAMEVPVVTSPLAAAGLHTEDGETPPVEVARNRRQFAQRIIRHLAAGADNRAPDAAARNFVRRHFCWHHSGRKLERVIVAVHDAAKGSVAPCLP